MNKILISAYACEPDKGSEPGVGWNWSKQISKTNKVIVITRENNRKSIEKALNSETNDNINFIYYDLPKYLTFWKKKEKGLHLYYYMWQLGAYLLAKKVVKEENIDTVFSPTFGNIWKVTFMHKLPCKFIWGPVGGGEYVPKEFIKKVTYKQRIFEYIRRICKFIPIANPWFYDICRKSEFIIVRTKDTLECIPKKYNNKCKIMIETGVSDNECKQISKISEVSSNSKSFVIMGRLISLKLVDIGIKSFKNVLKEHPDAVLEIVGDGECRRDLEKMVKELGIEKSVKFHGFLKREEALKVLGRSRALLMTSCKEGGAWVLFEAMMCKKPIICMNTSGMKTVVNENCGIKIDVKNYDEMVIEFEEAMKTLINNDELCNRMGNDAFKHVSTKLNWDEKNVFFDELLKSRI